jgi:hypothetical protein
MKFFYTPIFSLAIENDYYGELACSDLIIKPTDETVKTLQQYAWILKASDSGFTILAKVKADTINPNLPSKTLFHLLDPSEIPVLRFTVSVKNPQFLNFTDLDRNIPLDKHVFYLNNIYNFNTDKGKFLKDSTVLSNQIIPVANSNIPANNAIFGTPIKWLSQPTYRNTFTVLANIPSASVKVQARHHDTNIVQDLKIFSYTFPAVHPAEKVEYVVDLSKTDNLKEGRYTFSDDKGNSQALFYAPKSGSESPLGIIELFGKTGNQPFLNGDLVSGNQYKMRFTAKQVILQYYIENISLKPDGELRHRLINLTVDTFDKSVIIGDSASQYGKVAFTAPSILALNNDKTPSLPLKHNGAILMKLPKPSPLFLPEWNEVESRYYVRIPANV